MQVLDWEWSQLEVTLEKLNMQPRLPILRKYWDYKRLVQSASTGNDLTSKVGLLQTILLPGSAFVISVIA